MKLVELAFGALATVAATAALSTSAQAQNYPWCAIYSAFGARNCGFVTYEQCWANVRGVGGTCNANPMFVPPSGPRPHASRWHRAY